jgi:hypothetical protein
MKSKSVFSIILLSICLSAFSVAYTPPGNHRQSGNYTAPGAEINLGKMREIREKPIYGNAFRRPHKYGIMTSPDVGKPFLRKNTLGKPFNRLER